MYEIIILLLCLFFSCIGFSAILGRVWMWLVKPKNCKKSSLVIFLDGEEDASQIYYYLEKYRWYGSVFADELIFFYNSEISSEIFSMCKSFANVRLVPYNAMKDLLE